MPPKRMTANPLKPSRHRPGKIAEAADTSSEEEESDVETNNASAIKAPPKVTTAVGITSNLQNVSLDERRRIAAAKEAARAAEAAALKAKEEEGFVTEEESESADGKGSGSELEDSSEEESSGEEAPRRVMIRPIFIKKAKRGDHTRNIEADTKTEEQLSAEEEARKTANANAIVEEQIRKDLAAKEAGKKNWDDDEEEDEVDDEDDVDPEAEQAAWKLRELTRIKRERTAIEEREKELEEVERRKNLTEEERRREDDEYISAQKAKQNGKEKMGFMQKYYHKGAFYQDEAEAQGLGDRELMGAQRADDVNRELLPQALQMRDMTKIGKKGATKYKDLKSEDTGRWGQDFDTRRGPGRFNERYGGDERFAPDRPGDRAGASGANNLPVGPRKQVTGVPEGPRSTIEDASSKIDMDVNTHRPSRDRSRSRPRSPGGERKTRDSRSSRRRRDSRSPRRDRDRDDRHHRRKRSSSRAIDYDRYESDKRRRIDSR